MVNYMSSNEDYLDSLLQSMSPDYKPEVMEDEPFVSGEVIDLKKQIDAELRDKDVVELMDDSDIEEISEIKALLDGSSDDLMRVEQEMEAQFSDNSKNEFNLENLINDLEEDHEEKSLIDEEGEDSSPQEFDLLNDDINEEAFASGLGLALDAGVSDEETSVSDADFSLVDDEEKEELGFSFFGTAQEDDELGTDIDTVNVESESDNLLNIDSLTIGDSDEDDSDLSSIMNFDDGFFDNRDEETIDVMTAFNGKLDASGDDDENQFEFASEITTDPEPKLEKIKEPFLAKVAKIFLAEKIDTEEEKMIDADEDGKKKDKKKDKKKKGVPELDEDGNPKIDEKTQKKLNKKKEKEEKKKKKKEEQSFVFEVEESSKYYTKKNIIAVIIVCFSIGLCGYISVQFVMSAMNTREVKHAYDNKDYEKAYQLLYGKELDENEDIIYQRSYMLLRMKNKMDEANSYKEDGDRIREVDALIQGVVRYDNMKERAIEYLVIDEIDIMLEDIGVRLSEYGVTIEKAREIANIEMNTLYSEEIENICK